MTTHDRVQGIRELPHYVYRCYDATGRLLYVGCSIDPEKRMKEHRYFRTWWTDRITRITLEGFPDQAAGRVAEKKAIQDEHPIHNRQFRMTNEQRANWQPEHYINWLTALLEDPCSDRRNPNLRREINRAAEDFFRRFGRNLRKEVSRVRVGSRRYDEVCEAKYGPPEWTTPKWRVA